MTVRLAAGDAVLQVDPDDGGRWTSLRVADLELLTGVSLPEGPRPWLSGCFPMAPYAGRVRGGVLDFRGEQHRLPRTSPPHAMHGTVLDVPWEVAAAGPAGGPVGGPVSGPVRLGTPLRAPWPFAGRVEQTLVLSADRLAARLQLTAEQDMPAWLGLHPWFPRRLARGGPAQLEVRGGRQYVRGPDGVPTGELVAPRPGPWDDCFRDLEAPPLLRWPGAVELRMTSSHRTWVLFDERPDALCVEPQTAPPDALRLGLADVVPAGGELSLHVELAWRLL